MLADNASWLFRATPYVTFAAIWVAAALVPTFATGLLFNWTADLIVIVALLGTARFFLALAGMDIGTSFGGIGSSREVMIAALAEPAMLMIVFCVALIAGSTHLSTVADYIASTAVGLRVSLGAGDDRAGDRGARRERPHPGRQSLDPSRTHHGARGDDPGIFRPASGADRIRRAAQAAALCLADRLPVLSLGHRRVRRRAASAYLAGAALYLLKITIAGFLLAMFETATAKMRVFRVPQFLGAALMLGLLGTLLLFVSKGL